MSLFSVAIATILYPVLDGLFIPLIILFKVLPSPISSILLTPKPVDQSLILVALNIVRSKSKNKKPSTKP